MSKGVLIFAFNNDHFDYISMARTAAQLAKDHLGLPTTLITNSSIEADEDFEKVIYQPITETQQRAFRSTHTLPFIDHWHNKSRDTAYALSPYAETLLIDADYFIQSNALLSVFGSDFDVSCYRTAEDYCGLDELADAATVNRFASDSIPMYWATVIYFKKTKFAENVFRIIAAVKANYETYSELFALPNAGLYRNDFALSIALHKDKTKFSELPFKMLSIFAGTGSTDIDTNGRDIHIMNKELLTTSLIKTLRKQP